MRGQAWRETGSLARSCPIPTTGDRNALNVGRMRKSSLTARQRAADPDAGSSAAWAKLTALVQPGLSCRRV